MFSRLLGSSTASKQRSLVLRSRGAGWLLVALLGGCGAQAPESTASEAAVEASSSSVERPTASAVEEAEPTLESSSEEAEPAQVELLERDILVLGGGTTEDSALLWLEENRSKLTAMEIEWVQVKSEEIDGLNPGFVIFVGGSCEPMESSARFEPIQKWIDGAYVRTVRVPESFSSCPQAKVEPPESPSRERLGLRLSADGDTGCSIVEISVTHYWPGDINVTPRHHLLATLPVPCPERWSVDLSEDHGMMLINADVPYLAHLGRGEEAEVLPVGQDTYDVAYFDGDTPVVVFRMPHSGSENGGENITDAPLPVTYEGKTYMVQTYALGSFMCVSRRWVDGQWVDAGEPRLGLVLEGSRAPYCSDTDLLGTEDRSLGRLLASVDPSIREEMQAIAGGEDWSWASIPSSRPGDLAVSTFYLSGSQLTGSVLAYDGVKARPMEGLSGSLEFYLPFSDGFVYLCTSKGWGVFDSRTGSQHMWETGQCPIVLP